MDNLLQVLIEAVRSGTALAMPVLIGYFAMRVTETLANCATGILVVLIIGKTILAGMRLQLRP